MASQPLHVPKYSHQLASNHMVEDRLSRSDLASGILSELIRPGVGVVGVYGSWGSGKSFVLQLVVDEMRRNAPHHHPVVFEPWIYELENDLAAGLVSTLIADLLTIETADGSIMDEALEKGRRLLATMWQVARRVNPTLDSVASLAELAIDSYSADKTQYPAPAVEQVRSQMYEFVSRFGEVLGDQDFELVIFVDDLDRCSPENMVKLFEWMKVHFLKNPRVKFVVALDHVAAARAIVGRYGTYLGADKDISYGFRYLEKLVDVEFELVESRHLEAMALAEISSNRFVSVSSFAVSRHGTDFPGIGWIDDLMSMSALRNPRTTMKIVWRYGRVMDLLDSSSGEQFRKRLPSSYPFWILLLVAMYFRLEPAELELFVARQGTLHHAMSGKGVPSELRSGPLLEFASFGTEWEKSAGASAQIPSEPNLRDLAALVRELRI